jgi:hypothetical protein
MRRRGRIPRDRRTIVSMRADPTRLAIGVAFPDGERCMHDARHSRERGAAPCCTRPRRRPRRRSGASDALPFCTPEYAGALPGSFKNLLDRTVGGGETYGMPVGWVNVSRPAVATLAMLAAHVADRATG